MDAKKEMKKEISSCYGCEYGDRLDLSEQKETGKQMFCRKKWIPIMDKEYENCDDFTPFKYISRTTYLGGGCSGR